MMDRGHSSEAGFTLIEILAAVALLGVLAGIAVPVTNTSLAGYRFQSDAQAVSNLVSLTKMRAAARGTRARAFVDLAANRHSMQVWDRAAATWVTEDGPRQLAWDVTFGAARLTVPPPNTQVALGFAPACLADDGTPIANTSCIVFNSRGIPIDPITGAPVGGNALYLTNNIGVYAITVTTTPMVRFWWSPARDALWVEQQ